MAYSLPELTLPRLVFLTAGGSLAIFLGALFFEALGFAPCEMCLWQRWPHRIAVALGLLWFITRGRGFSTFILPVGALLMWGSAGLAFFHTGVEKKWWPGPSSCTSSGGDLGALSADALLPSASLDAAIVLCDEVNWEFLGLSMASYNVLGSIVFALLWMMAWTKARETV